MVTMDERRVYCKTINKDNNEKSYTLTHTPNRSYIVYHVTVFTSKTNMLHVNVSIRIALG